MTSAVDPIPVPPDLATPAQSTAMPEWTRNLAGVDLDCLWLIIDRSLQVRRRHHFYNWTQGALQSLLQHDVLICATNDGQSRELRVDTFSSVPIDPALTALLQRRENGLIGHLVRSWRRFDRQPVGYQRRGAQVNVDEPLAATLARVPYDNLAAHGVCAFNGEPSSFFGMLCLPGAVTARQLYLLDALVPYLHTAWLRVHIDQPPAGAGTSAEQRPAERAILTGRELEIMHWVHQGKSNIEIGMILAISPLTVKNHVQKILRKLNVQNRTQAVSKILALDLLRL